MDGNLLVYLMVDVLEYWDIYIYSFRWILRRKGLGLISSAVFWLMKDHFVSFSEELYKPLTPLPMAQRKKPRGGKPVCRLRLFWIRQIVIFGTMQVYSWQKVHPDELRYQQKIHVQIILKFINAYIHLHTYTYMYIHKHIHTYTTTYIYTHIHTYTYIYIHTYIHTCMHAYIH